MRAFLDLCGCQAHTRHVVKDILKPKGIVGFKKRLLAHGSGGSRKGKINSVWSGNAEQLKAAFRHVAQGNLV